mgnify:CR=1 FL=1
MGAFDTAWRVLKNERELRQIGEGGFRAVYEGDNENEVIKVPRRGLPTSELSHNALMNAFAQLGYPVEPEKMQILPPHRAINPHGGPAGRMAADPVTVRPFNTLGYTQRRADIADKNIIGPMMDERERDISDDLLGVHGANFYRRKGLRDNTSPAVFRTWDLKPSNLGVFDGEIRALDALTARPSHLMDKNSFLLAHGLADLPKAERRSLVNLFTDKSQFQDIADYDFSQENSLPLSQRENTPKLQTEGYTIDHRNDKFVPQTPMELAHNAYSRYLQDVRAMQLANSMVEDPYQTRLEEFVDPNQGPESLSSFEERLRAMETGKARRELALQNTGDMSKIGPTFPFNPNLKTLFPPRAPPAPKVEPPPQPYVPMNQYTDTASTRDGPAPAA